MGESLELHPSIRGSGIDDIVKNEMALPRRLKVSPLLATFSHHNSWLTRSKGVPDESPHPICRVPTRHRNLVCSAQLLKLNSCHRVRDRFSPTTCHFIQFQTPSAEQ
jgi:hypothetical protein